MIYYEVEAGLCNRLRGMVSAYHFAKDIQQSLTVIWKRDSNCNCRFESIFSVEDKNYIKIKEIDCMGESVIARVNHQIEKYHISFIKSRCCKLYNCDLREIPIEELKRDVSRGNMYLKCNSYWYDSPNSFDLLKLNPTLEQKVDELIGKCGEKRVGVHIRRTDHQICKRQSPTEAFVREMQKEDKDVCFYVASDDLQEIQKLQQIFGTDRIIYNSEAELKRNTELGMKDAAIDLYALARTNKIYGSEGSSFTDIAGMIGHIAVIRCTTKE